MASTESDNGTSRMEIDDQANALSENGEKHDAKNGSATADNASKEIGIDESSGAKESVGSEEDESMKSDNSGCVPTQSNDTKEEEGISHDVDTANGKKSLQNGHPGHHASSQSVKTLDTMVDAEQRSDIHNLAAQLGENPLDV